jgi:hypothetical protein
MEEQRPLNFEFTLRFGGGTAKRVIEIGVNQQAGWLGSGDSQLQSFVYICLRRFPTLHPGIAQPKKNLGCSD